MIVEKKLDIFFILKFQPAVIVLRFKKKINIFRYFYNVQKLIKNINASNKRKI